VKTDVQPVYYASRALFDGLLRRGIRIFEYQGPVLHAKTILIDGAWSSIGSYNLDHLSIIRNLEVTAIVLDETFGSCLEAHFEKDFKNSKEVKLAEWRRRSPRRMLLEWFWFQFRSLL
jgi:cardiolipin synthase